MATLQNLQAAFDDDPLTSLTQSARSGNNDLSVHNLLNNVFRLAAMSLEQSQFLFGLEFAGFLQVEKIVT